MANGYVDSFSDLPLDVDQDGFTDVIQVGYFARRIVWIKNPGKTDGEWTEHLIDAIGPTEFAFLVDLDNDGKADDPRSDDGYFGHCGSSGYDRMKLPRFGI